LVATAFRATAFQAGRDPLGFRSHEVLTRGRHWCRLFTFSSALRTAHTPTAVVIPGSRRLFPSRPWCRRSGFPWRSGRRSCRRPGGLRPRRSPPAA